MDSFFLEIQQIQAIKRSRSSKNSRLHLFYFYSFIIITLAILFSIPLWLPYLWSSTTTTRWGSLLFSIPIFASFSLTPKFVFIICNLIVLILVGDSKIFHSGASVPKEKLQSFSAPVSGGDRKEATFHENVNKCIHHASGTILVAEEERKDIDREGGARVKELSYEYDFKKRADDFIARVNTQRKLEAKLLLL